MHNLDVNSQRKKNQKRKSNSNNIFIKELNANLKVTSVNGCVLIFFTLPFSSGIGSPCGSMDGEPKNASSLFTNT